jgi:C4-dicarboxylate transporter DctM subunit
VIPPSVALILYGVTAEVSVVRLFTAGFIPGLFIALFFFTYIIWVARRAKNVDRGEPFALGHFLEATRESIWALLMPAVIMGGIYSGMFSATEAGGIASVYAVIVSVFIYREIDLKGLYDATCRAAFITSQLMLIVGAAGVYSWLLTTSGVATKITAFFAAADLAPWTILLFINILLLVVGFFLDPPAAIPLMVPILLPIVKAAGIDLVHFGIVVTVNLSIGMFTPPFGANIFVAQAVFKQPLSVIYTGVIPFTIISTLALVVITYVPELSLWLTRLHD